MFTADTGYVERSIIFGSLPQSRDSHCAAVGVQHGCAPTSYVSVTFDWLTRRDSGEGIIFRSSPHSPPLSASV